MKGRPLALLACVALVGCAAPVQPRHAAVSIVGHTRAAGCAEAAEAARHVFLIEEESR